MFHHDIMRPIMRERVREMRAEARAARAGRLARRAREFWADRADGNLRPARPSRGGAAPAR